MAPVVDYGLDVSDPYRRAAVPTTLVLNPRSDARFVAQAEAMVADGVDSPVDLQARLRKEYPDAIVRARDLDGEALSIWYVYRDGHWIPRTDPGC
jgi:hypothetical protein